MRTLIVSMLLLAGCENETKVTEAEAALYEAAFEQASTLSMVTQEKWARSCGLCHVSGAGGAPRLGDPDAWQDSRDRGNAVMMKHTLEGLNRMPPLGYCMDCDLEDFAAMIVMMAGSE